MRAGCVAFLACAWFGTAALIPSAEAANERQARNTAAQTSPQTSAQRRAAQALTNAAVMPVSFTQVSLRGTTAGYGTPMLPVSAASGVSCVPFARMATGMQISGDARLWWANAAGTYRRGQQPERGAVLAFMASGGMSRGHVSVVSRVVNDRTLLVDHSNWTGPGIPRGTVTRGVRVVDVSDRNDWTAVRVQSGRDADAFGRTYPTHGFIYNRPFDGRILTASAQPMQEVAEASPHAALHMRLAGDLLGR